MGLTLEPGSEHRWREFDESRASAERNYREDADSVGSDWGQINNKINFIEELSTLTLLQQNTHLRLLMRSIWRRLSGVQHAYSYAGVVGAQHVDAVPIPGGQRAKLTVNDDTMLLELRATAWLQLCAMQAYVSRTRERAVGGTRPHA